MSKQPKFGAYLYYGFTANGAKLAGYLADIRAHGCNVVVACQWPVGQLAYLLEACRDIHLRAIIQPLEWHYKNKGRDATTGKIVEESIAEREKKMQAAYASAEAARPFADTLLAWKISEHPLEGAKWYATMLAPLLDHPVVCEYGGLVPTNDPAWHDYAWFTDPTLVMLYPWVDDAATHGLSDPEDVVKGFADRRGTEKASYYNNKHATYYQVRARLLAEANKSWIAVTQARTSPERLRIQSLVAVALGAKGLLLYPYADANTAAGTSAACLAADGRPNPQWDEFARVVADLRDLTPSPFELRWVGQEYWHPSVVTGRFADGAGAERFMCANATEECVGLMTPEGDMVTLEPAGYAMLEGAK